MPSLRSGPPASLYVAGPFAQGYTEVYNFLIPFYGLSLGMSAGNIGMLVGARSLLAFPVDPCLRASPAAAGWGRESSSDMSIARPIGRVP
jgi:hypothetical protein